MKGFTMSDKMTKKEAFLFCLTVLAGLDGEVPAAVYDVVAHEIVMLDKKSNAGNGDAKRLAEQKVLMDAIVVTLDASDEPLTATQVAVGASCSVQRATALLKKLVASHEVARDDSDKKPLFTLA